MRQLSSILRVIPCIILIAANFVTTAAKANVFDDAWGIATDPFKLGTSTTNIMRALVQLHELEGVANNHVKERLDQLRLIVADSLNKIDDIEDKINNDSKELILRATCATGTVLNGQIQDALASALNIVGNANPKITIGGVTLIEIRTKIVHIANPDDAYYDAKNLILSNLEKVIVSDSNPQIIFSSYVNLARSAKATRCAYLDSTAEKDFQDEAADMELLAIPWRTTFTTTGKP